MIKDAHDALLDIQSSGRSKELLAQGLMASKDRSPEQEKIERRRLVGLLGMGWGSGWGCWGWVGGVGGAVGDELGEWVGLLGMCWGNGWGCWGCVGGVGGAVRDELGEWVGLLGMGWGRGWGCWGWSVRRELYGRLGGERRVGERDRWREQ